MFANFQRGVKFDLPCMQLEGLKSRDRIFRAHFGKLLNLLDDPQLDVEGTFRLRACKDIANLVLKTLMNRIDPKDSSRQGTSRRENLDTPLGRCRTLGLKHS